MFMQPAIGWLSGYLNVQYDLVNNIFFFFRRLDYFILSKRLMDNVCDSDIRSEVLGSDHCPIVLYINV